MMNPQDADLLLVAPGGNIAAVMVRLLNSRRCINEILTNQDACDEKADHVHQVSSNQRPSSSKPVNKQNAEGLCKQPNDVVNSLIFERIGAADTNLSVYLDAILLDGGNAGHLNRSLESASDEKTAE